ncbi:fatty-acyl-CoA synthase [Bradyrhizobium sp. USDA 4463]
MHNGEPSGGGTIGDLIIGALNRYHDRTAFVHGAQQISYGEVADTVSRLIQLFEKCRLEAGDTVVQVASSCPEQWCVTAACYIAGLRSVTLHSSGGSVEDQAKLISRSAASIVICDSQDDRVSKLKERCSDVRLWYSHGRDCTGVANLWEQASVFPPGPLKNVANSEDIIRLGYTGGTTGPRKGVLLSNRSLLAMTMISLSDVEWPERPCVLSAEAVAGGFGNMILPTLQRGGTFIMQGDFDPSAFLDAVQQHRPNVLLFLPPTLRALMSDPRAKERDWSHLSLLIYSGANLPVPVIREALDLFGPVLCQVYGQTECPKSLAVLRKTDHASKDEKLLGSLGQPCSGIQTVLLDHQLRECEVGQVGELCVRGPIVTSGYWMNPAATQRATEGGWWHTGDLCVRDERGYLYFVDRAEDAVIAAGRLIYPRLLEERLMAHPAVQAVAVMLSGTASGSVAARAIVVQRGDLNEDELRPLAEGEDGVRLISLHSTDQLPRTAIGRIDRGTLRERYGHTHKTQSELQP